MDWVKKGVPVADRLQRVGGSKQKAVRQRREICPKELPRVRRERRVDVKRKGNDDRQSLKGVKSGSRWFDFWGLLGMRDKPGVCPLRKKDKNWGAPLPVGLGKVAFSSEVSWVERIGDPRQGEALPPPEKTYLGSMS